MADVDEVGSPSRIQKDDAEMEEVPVEPEIEDKLETLNANEEFKAEVLEIFDMFDKEKDNTIEVS